MKKYKIIWSPQSYDDLKSIHLYIKYHLKEKDIANKIIKDILKSISDLNYLPDKFTRVQILNNETKKHKENACG